MGDYLKIQISVKTNSRHESVEKISDTEYKVAVNAPPTEGKANEAIIKLLAKYFSLPKSSIQIAKGLASKKKWVVLAE